MNNFLTKLTPNDEVRQYQPTPESWYNPQLLRTSLSQSYENTNPRLENLNTDVENLLKTVRQACMNNADDAIKRQQQQF